MAPQNWEFWSTGQEIGQLSSKDCSQSHRISLQSDCELSFTQVAPRSLWYWWQILPSSQKLLEACSCRALLHKKAQVKKTRQIEDTSFNFELFKTSCKSLHDYNSFGCLVFMDFQLSLKLLWPFFSKRKQLVQLHDHWLSPLWKMLQQDKSWETMF
jgi:hypothetical protein